MNRTVTFCGFLVVVMVAITLGGFVLLAFGYVEWQAMQEEAESQTDQDVDTVFESEPELRFESVQDRFSDELSSFQAIELLSDEDSGQFLYKITLSNDQVRYIAWGSGAVTVPDGVTEISTGVLEPGAARAWAFVDTGDRLLLSDEPFLLR